MDRTVARFTAIAIGSNLGDRYAALAFATRGLSAFVTNLTLSASIETEPQGEALEDQPLYLNAVAVGQTALGPRELLDALLALEGAYGLERPSPGAPRTLDLDLILLGDTLVDVPGLQVPHPRFRERFFVLGPLAEVAPDAVDPLTGLRAWELLRNLLQDDSR